jgi:signal transduction histidine kinase
MKILLVDDDEVDRLAVRRALRAARLEGDVEDAATPEAAFVALDAHAYDCVLLDYNLPGLDGFQVMRRMQEKGVLTPVVVLTGHGDEQTAVELMKAGAVDYISKSSLSPDRLLQSVRYATDCHRLERERNEAFQREQEARKSAEEASLAKDHFLAVVSHDLRTPLNAILGWARILLVEKADDSMRRRGLEVIERNARAQTQLIDDLLDVSRIISGKLHLDVRSLEPLRVCEDALDAVRLAAETKGIKLEADLQRSAGPIIGDPNRLQQVVWNLLSNAIKFTPAGGTVTLTLRRLDSGAEIAVADAGRGISPEFLPRVFERFAQADSRGKRAEGGLGLGLAIVRRVVELHGGTVEAESAGEDQGARFVVHLPSTPSPAPPAQQQREQTPVEAPPLAREGTLRGLVVLFVDDSADARELVSTILARQGSKTIVCSSTDEALAALERERPDVVISDIEMPNSDGYDLIRALRVREDPRSRIPAIALTGYTRAEDRIRMLSAGFQTHVPKPVDPTVVATLAGRVV